MFERFTDRARRAIVLAQEEARALDHDHVGPEHLLLGLISLGDGVAFLALEALGVRSGTVREQVAERAGRGQDTPSGHIPFTKPAKQVLELSLREAMHMGHNYIGTEHLLLGLIRQGDGVAADILVAAGVDLPVAREKVTGLLHGHEARLRERGTRRRAQLAVDPGGEMAGPGITTELEQAHAEIERLRGLLRDRGVDPGEPQPPGGAG